MKNSILKKYSLFTFIFLISLTLFSCGASKRSDCPTYRDSDPKIIFGEVTLAERMKEQEKDLQVKSDKQRRKEAQKQIKLSTKTKKRSKK